MSAGFFGKLPSRGDFLQGGLAPTTVALLDGWIVAGLQAARASLNADFERTWELAPHWRFGLDAGVLGSPRPLCGVWVPSMDRAERCFPLLVLARAGTDLDALERLAVAAVRHGHGPDDLAHRLAAIRSGGGPEFGHGWWRRAMHDGSLVRLSFGGLPSGDQFLQLLRLQDAERAWMRD